MADVVRTRIYVTNADDWEVIGRAHARFFADVRPANTLVEVQPPRRFRLPRGD